MSGRSRLEDVKLIADKLRKNSPALIEEIKTLARNPRAVSTWIEAKSPWLNRQFIGAASNLTEPFTVGMGLNVDKLEEDLIEVTLPASWRNQGLHGVIHSAALMVVGEFAIRGFWEHHLDLRQSELVSRRQQVRSLATARGNVRAIYRLPIAEREAVLHQLRADGRAELEAEAQVYDQDGRLVAEVDVTCELKRQLALGGKEAE